MSEIMYKQKYLKYKKKYLNLKNNIGGSNDVINKFSKAQDSNDISNIIDNINNIKDNLKIEDVRKIVTLARETKDRLGYEQWNKEIRYKFYKLLEYLKQKFEADPNIIYALPPKDEDEDLDIEKKMEEDDNKNNTDEESFGLKINNIVKNITQKFV